MRLLFGGAVIAWMVSGCAGRPTCPSGARLEAGTCVRTIVETRVECPKGSHLRDGHCFGDELRVAKVDFAAAFLETFEAKAAQERLKIIFERHQHELDQRTADLQREKDDIEKDSKVITREALERRSATYREHLEAIQKTFVDYQKDLKDQENAALKEGLDSTRRSLERFAVESAKAEGFVAIFDGCVTAPPPGVVCDATKPFWIAPGMEAGAISSLPRWDLTPSVIARYKADLAGK